MKQERTFESETAKLEAQLSEADIKGCRDSAELCEFHEKGVSYQSAYIIALMQQVAINTTGDYNGT